MQTLNPTTIDSGSARAERSITGNIAALDSKASLLGTAQGFDRSYPGAGGYREREGYSAGPSRKGNQVGGMWLPDSLWTWSFLVYTLVQSAVVIALQV